MYFCNPIRTYVNEQTVSIQFDLKGRFLSHLLQIIGISYKRITKNAISHQ